MGGGPGLGAARRPGEPCSLGEHWGQGRDPGCHLYRQPAYLLSFPLGCTDTRGRQLVPSPTDYYDAESLS